MEESGERIGGSEAGAGKSSVGQKEPAIKEKEEEKEEEAVKGLQGISTLGEDEKQALRLAALAVLDESSEDLEQARKYGEETTKTNQKRKISLGTVASLGESDERQSLQFAQLSERTYNQFAIYYSWSCLLH